MQHKHSWQVTFMQIRTAGQVNKLKQKQHKHSWWFTFMQIRTQREGCESTESGDG
jgi:hypothetical protein